VGGKILWDVDTQVDFIEPGGKLYFAGAEEAKPAMARLVEAVRAAQVVHVASTDQHELSATEICDDAAVRALLRRGRRIAFVEDAARGVDESQAAACVEAWRGLGVRTTTAEEAAASLG
jgi:nicotinamidase-related amidase